MGRRGLLTVGVDVVGADDACVGDDDVDGSCVLESGGEEGDLLGPFDHVAAGEGYFADLSGQRCVFSCP